MDAGGADTTLMQNILERASARLEAGEVADELIAAELADSGREHRSRGVDHLIEADDQHHHRVVRLGESRVQRFDEKAIEESFGVSLLAEFAQVHKVLQPIRETGKAAPGAPGATP